MNRRRRKELIVAVSILVGFVVVMMVISWIT